MVGMFGMVVWWYGGAAMLMLVVRVWVRVRVRVWSGVRGLCAWAEHGHAHVDRGKAEPPKEHEEGALADCGAN